MVQTSSFTGLNKSISILASNGGSVLATGILGALIIPYGGLITGVNLLANVSGSCVIDIWKAPYGSYPPTSANSITASDKPTISSGVSYQDTTLTGWTTQVNQSDVLIFNLNSVTSITQLTVALQLAMQ